MTAIVFLLSPLDAAAEADEQVLSMTLTEQRSAEPALSVLDLGASRGDGVFETLGVIDGRAHGVDAHLARLAESARMLDLPQPNLAQWRYAIDRLVERLPASGQSALKLVMTRGVDGSGVATCWLTGLPSNSDFAERTDGISVVALDRGLSSDIAARSPWLLAGAKTLSYAINMAAIREAKRRGADDVVFISTDGFALEGPTSSLILKQGDAIITPSTDGAILAGTTQADLFTFFESRGFSCEYRLVDSDELYRSDALWLVSSVRLAAPIVSVDGAPVGRDAELTAAMNAALLGRATAGE